MDCSVEYIKMCRKAVEVQEAWEPKVGDYIWRRYTLLGEEIDSQIWDEDERQEIIILTYASSVEGYIHATNEQGDTRIYKSHNDAHKSTSIWLPRQDQLQDMVAPDIIFLHKCGAMVVWLEGQSLRVHKEFSGEMCWLAFVMWELHSKKWDGQNWAKEAK